MNKYFIILLFVLSICKNISWAEKNETNHDMKSFLSEYYYSPERTQKGYSKLLFAIEKDYRDLAFKLLEKGENPNYQSPTNLNDLMIIGEEVYKISGTGIPTPFLLAIYKEDEELISAMIRNGADVNLKSFFPKDISMRSPLSVAASYNKSEKITQMLCDGGANVISNQRFDNSLYSVLQKADISKFLIIAQTISEKEIQKTYDDWSLLMALGGYHFSEEQKENSLKIAEYLIERGLVLENENYSALSSAIRNGNKKLVEYFLSLGANINHMPKKRGWNHEISFNPLFAAIEYYESQIKYVNPENKFLAPQF